MTWAQRHSLWMLVVWCLALLTIMALLAMGAA